MIELFLFPIPFIRGEQKSSRPSQERNDFLSVEELSEMIYQVFGVANWIFGIAMYVSWLQVTKAYGGGEL